MIIILEGLNGSGKSTLATKLCKKYHLSYLKEDRFKYNMHESYKTYLELSLGLPDNVLLDRWHLGESVYPYIKHDGRPGLLDWQQHAVERILANRGAVLIMCTASNKFIKHVYNTRGETFLKLNEVPKERNLFDACYERSILPKCKFNPEHDYNLIKTLDKLVQTAKCWSELSPTLCGNYVLNQGMVMLVGDSFYGLDHAYREHAFSGFSGCSDYLHKAIELTKYPGSFYLTNFYKLGDDNFNKYMFMFELKFKPNVVIALGNNASEGLKSLRIKHLKLPHPQWYKRFMHKHIKDYAMALKLARLDGYEAKHKLLKEVS